MFSLHSQFPLFTKVLVLSVVITLSSCSPSGPPLTANGEPTIVVMDFETPQELDPLPEGWRERTFWTIKPMTFSQGEQAGRRAVRFATNDSASMVGRELSIAIADYPFLEWGWLIEKPINSQISETLHEGDDHPARLFVQFLDANEERRSMEIIWANREFKRGEYKIIGTFHHYVANGGDPALIGRWFDERVDLRSIYQRIWGSPDGVKLINVAVFCDSDETADKSIAWFSSIALHRK